MFAKLSSQLYLYLGMTVKDNVSLETHPDPCYHELPFSFT